LSVVSDRKTVVSCQFSVVSKLPFPLSIPKTSGQFTQLPGIRNRSLKTDNLQLTTVSHISSADGP